MSDKQKQKQPQQPAKAKQPPKVREPRAPRPQPTAWAGRGEKRKIRRSAINWSAPDAHEQWLENVKARREELRKGN